MGKQYLDRGAEGIVEKWKDRLPYDASVSDVIKHLDAKAERQHQREARAGLTNPDD